MSRTSIVVVLGLVLAAEAAFGQVTSDFTLTAQPTVNIPVGPRISGELPLYAPVGAGLSIKGEYTPPFAPFLYTGLVFDADWLPTNGYSSSLVSLSLGAEVGVQLFPVQRFGIRAAGWGGMYLGVLNAGTVRNPFLAGMVDLSYLVVPSFSVGAGFQYRANFVPGGLAYHGAGVTLGARWHIGAGTGKAKLEVTPAVSPIFPLFYGYYDKNPAGSVTIRNQGKASLENVTVSFFVKQYMEQPKVSWQAPALPRDGEAVVPVYALFRDTIFGVTEGTKVAGEIMLSYRYLGADVAESYPLTVTVNNRNAMSWDDTNKAAAFVTAKDPSILGFTKKIAADAKSRAQPPAFSANFRIAMALFESMNLQGIGYTPDPTTPYSKLSENKEAVDYLQFPMQTLAYRAGDCDDLSILYAALLESVGIRAAFVTAPGHIYVAFDLDSPAAEARSTVANPDDLIVRDDGTWIPVEVTRLTDGFLRAWREGANEWRRTSANGSAGFYPVREAWGTYEPVSSATVVQNAPTLPDPDKVLTQMQIELGRFLKSDLEPRETALRGELRTTPGSVRALNKLGVLYARFGRLADARRQFEAITEQSAEVPASVLVNLGNLSYIDGAYNDAVALFRRALEKMPENSAALLGLLLSAYEAGDSDNVAVAYTALKRLDPVTASKYEYMATGGGEARSASVERGASMWGDE